jgi:tetratricopeptide (TPR) repeat protein
MQNSNSNSMENAKSLFISGLRKLECNNFIDAEIDFEASLKLAPNRISTLINLSIVLIKLNKFEKAESLIKVGLLHHPHNKELLMNLKDIYSILIDYNPDYAEAYTNLGNILKELGIYDKALAAYDAAIKLAKNLPEVYSNKANLLQILRRYEEALENYDKAINLKPDYVEAYSNKGNALYELSRFDEAIYNQNKAIQINPDYAEAYSNRGIIKNVLKKYKDAINDFDIAIVLKPNYAEAYSNRGNSLNELKMHQQALISVNYSIEMMPNYAEAFSNRGVILNELKNFTSALVDFDRAIFLNPNNATFHSNRGNTLRELMRYPEALEAHKSAIELKPNYAEAYLNLGSVLQELIRSEEAISSYDKAISLDSECVQAHFNKSILLLVTKKFESGWALYNHRWSVKAHSAGKFDTEIPYWNRQKTNSESKILLWAEQGIGDEIFYFGMLNNFAKFDAQITVSADVRLHALFKRSLPEAEFIDNKEITKVCDEIAFDYQAPIGDIGHLCSVAKLLEHQSPKPFLSINNSRSNDFKNKNHFLSDKFVCGISWKSNNKHIGSVKSLNLIDLYPLLSLENVEFVSLQYGSTADDIELVEKSIGRKIHTIGDLDIFNDLDGLTSLISLCDCVVTTSNITAHLTGAIGKKGMVLMPYSKGKIWYWHSGEGQSLWYPSLELVSQSHMNDWTDPINKCKEWVLRQL